MNLKEKVGNKIKLLREEKGYSIEYLANISNIDRTYVSEIEKGKRNVSITVIEKILIALDTDFATFFNENNFRK